MGTVSYARFGAASRREDASVSRTAHTAPGALGSLGLIALAGLGIGLLVILRTVFALWYTLFGSTDTGED